MSRLKLLIAIKNNELMKYYLSNQWESDLAIFKKMVTNNQDLILNTHQLTRFKHLIDSIFISNQKSIFKTNNSQLNLFFEGYLLVKDYQEKIIYSVKNTRINQENYLH